MDPYMNTAPLFFVIVICLVMQSSMSFANEHKAFSFYAFGNGPHTAGERTALRTQLKDLSDFRNKKDAQFIVHLGNIIPLGSDCSNDEYSDIYNIFIQNSPLLPVLALPGNNDWVTCDSPDVAWKHWKDYFLRPPLEDNWWAVSSLHGEIARQDGRRENFSFERDGVLFIGLNAPARTPLSNISEEEWERIITEDTEWIRDQLLLRKGVGSTELASDSSGVISNEDTGIRVVVVFGQSISDPRLLEVLFNHLQTSRLHVIYIHGSELEWSVEQPYADRGWKLFWTVQVDSEASGPPLKITMRGDESDSEWEAESTEQVRLGNLIKLHHTAGVDGDTGAENKTPGATETTLPSASTTTLTATPSATTKAPATLPPTTLAPAASTTAAPSMVKSTPLADQQATTTSTSSTSAPPLENSTGRLNLDANVLLELRWVRSLMNPDAQTAFEVTCDVFLSDLFLYSLPPVSDIKCDVLDQTILDPSRQLAEPTARNETQTVSNITLEDAGLALNISLGVSGFLESPNDEFGFEESVGDFFNVLGGQFVAALKGNELLDGPSKEYFGSVWNVQAIEETQEPKQNDNQATRNEEGSGGSKIFSNLGLALVILGAFVVGVLLAFWLLYRRHKRLATRYSDVGDGESKISHKIGITRPPSSANPSASLHLNPPSVVMRDNASDVDSMSRLQDFESITGGYIWSSSVVGSAVSAPGADEDARTESSSPISEGSQMASRQMESSTATNVSLPTLASGAPPSLAGGSTATRSPLANNDKKQKLNRTESAASMESESFPTIASGAPLSLVGGETVSSELTKGHSTAAHSTGVFSSLYRRPPKPPRLLTTDSASASSGGTHLIPFDGPLALTKPTGNHTASRTLPNKERAGASNMTTAAGQSTRSGSDTADWFGSMISDALGEDMGDSATIAAVSVTCGGGHGGSLKGVAGRRRAAAAEKKIHEVGGGGHRGARRGFLGFVSGRSTPLTSNKQVDREQQQQQLDAQCDDSVASC